MVVRAKNLVYSVSFPIPVFRDTAGLLLFLGLDFSAMISPVVHIGAIAVSFLFVVMMFNIQIAEIHEEVLRYLPVSDDDKVMYILDGLGMVFVTSVSMRVPFPHFSGCPLQAYARLLHSSGY
ncbi:uncharacterized protein LOC114579427 [Dendrobium catenatum]|uniref:uncharacterized protein LOC114579427 n=1 Tax=Dendrobium catenatum TaxID=906689 RepID=UPI0010A048A5|nr:uncharacterized protein LOC114579427 [Dendrobium catenatum]